MFKVEVEKFCEGCLNFEPIIHSDLYANFCNCPSRRKFNVVVCKHEYLCKKAVERALSIEKKECNKDECT